MKLTNEQLERYSRNIILFGGKGQKKLLAGKVLVIGAGGLGAPAALYLAAAGVGTIGIVDYDVVDLSNLQRQIIHSTASVGQRSIRPAIPWKDSIPTSMLSPIMNGSIPRHCPRSSTTSTTISSSTRRIISQPNSSSTMPAYWGDIPFPMPASSALVVRP